MSGPVWRCSSALRSASSGKSEGRASATTYNRTMDFPLWGGWHVTVFHPWALLFIVLVALACVALLLKLLVAR
jgi:hypothetical protein